VSQLSQSAACSRVPGASDLIDRARATPVHLRIWGPPGSDKRSVARGFIEMVTAREGRAVWVRDPATLPPPEADLWVLPPRAGAAIGAVRRIVAGRGRGLILELAELPPGPTWFRAPEVPSLLSRSVELRALTPEEARADTSLSGLPDAAAAQAVALAGGHPGLLRLAADTLWGSPDLTDAQLAARVAPQALAQFLPLPEDPSLRAALAVVSVLDYVTEERLGRLVPDSGGYALFEQLRTTPAARHHPRGLTLLPWARSLHRAELAWRAPAEFADLLCRCVRLLNVEAIAAKECSSDPPAQRERARVFTLAAGSPGLLPVRGVGEFSLRSFQPESDTPALEAFARRADSPPLRRAVLGWARRRPGTVVVCVDQEDRVRAVQPVLALEGRELQGPDPVFALLDDVWKPAPDDRIVLFGRCLGPDGVAGPSPERTLLLAARSLLLATTPGATHVATSAHEPAHARLLERWLGFRSLGSAAGVAFWGRRVNALPTVPPEVPPSLGPPPWAEDRRLADLDVQLVEQAVRGALAVRGDLAILESENPLTWSRIGRAPGGLAPVLRSLIDDLGRAPRGKPLANVLLMTYWKGAPSRQAAAERLGIPFGTYRGRLRRAVERLTSLLLRRERELESTSRGPDTPGR